MSSYETMVVWLSAGAYPGHQEGKDSFGALGSPDLSRTDFFWL